MRLATVLKRKMARAVEEMKLDPETSIASRVSAVRLFAIRLIHIRRILIHMPWNIQPAKQDSLLELEHGNSDRDIAVRVPGLVELRWPYYLLQLHKHPAPTPKLLLYHKGDRAYS